MPANTTGHWKIARCLAAGAIAALALSVHAQDIRTSVSYPALNATTVNTAVKVTGYGASARAPTARAQSATASSTVTTTSQGWTFTGNVPKIAPIPFDDDLTVPIPLGISEYTLSNPAKGFFRFENGRVESAVRVPLDTFTVSLPTRNQRPTLFISIGGFDGAGASIPGVIASTADVQPWQQGLQRGLSLTINSGQYKHFMVTWENGVAVGYQARVLTDYVKAFLGPKVDSWDVVLVGYSRGGIFANELSKRLAGFSKINSLHVWLLDPTAAPMLGDIYPTRLVDTNSAYGYLKYDGLPIAGLNFTTSGDMAIQGFNNYGAGVNAVTYVTSPPTPSLYSHFFFAGNWLKQTSTDPNNLDGFLGVMNRFTYLMKTTRPGVFVVDGDSGSEIVRIGAKDLAADLFANCTGGTCNITGSLSIGTIGSVAFNNMLATDGLDIAVASTIAAASTVVRRDYATVSATDILTQTSTNARIDSGGITISYTGMSGLASVNTELGLTNADVTVSIGNVNIPIISLNPISPVKSIIKKLKF